jgi:rod shape-determining protein MreD
MIAARVVLAGAGVVVALLVQAMVVGPLALAVAVSVPAVLVAAVAVQAGPGAGMSLGFCAGLLADLGSDHPAGVLAFGWLLLGVGAGRLTESRRLPAQAVLVGSAAALVSTAVALALSAAGRSGSSLGDVLRGAPYTFAGDAALAVPVVVLTAWCLRTRAPHPVRRPARGRARG